jgi:hypothetical protein
MMIAIRGYYDGKVIVPNGPVDLPAGKELLFHLQDATNPIAPTGVSGESLLRFSGTIGVEDLEHMSQAITEGCEQV